MSQGSGYCLSLGFLADLARCSVDVDIFSAQPGGPAAKVCKDVMSPTSDLAVDWWQSQQCFGSKHIAAPSLFELSMAVRKRKACLKRRREQRTTDDPVLAFISKSKDEQQRFKLLKAHQEQARAVANAEKAALNAEKAALDAEKAALEKVANAEKATLKLQVQLAHFEAENALLHKGLLQVQGLLMSRGLFERAAELAFHEQQQAKNISGKFNCTATLRTVPWYPQAGKWSLLLKKAIKACVNVKSKRGQEEKLQAVHNELSRSIHGHA